MVTSPRHSPGKKIYERAYDIRYFALKRKIADSFGIQINVDVLITVLVEDLQCNVSTSVQSNDCTLLKGPYCSA